MATRRPPVPKAHFTAGIGSAPDKPAGSTAPDPDLESSTPGTHPGGSPTSGGGAAGKPGKTGKSGKSGKSGRGAKSTGRERQPASGPHNRSHQDGVIHAAENSPVPARSFSGRLLVLGLAMGVVTLLLAPNVHTFLQQRAQISALQADIAAKQAQQGTFESELARWDDPAYVKQQARDRVSMLMPGETGYWVYGANGVEAVEGPEVDAAAAATTNTAKNATEITVQPWVDSLWGAIQESAKVQAPPAEPAPATAPAPTPSATPAP